MTNGYGEDIGHREEGKSFLGQKKCPRNSFPLFSTIPAHSTFR